MHFNWEVSPPTLLAIGGLILSLVNQFYLTRKRLEDVEKMIKGHERLIKQLTKDNHWFRNFIVTLCHELPGMDSEKYDAIINRVDRHINNRYD